MILLTLLSMALIPATAQAATLKPPYFTPADCGFTVPTGRTVKCGDVTVAEQHKVANGKTIKLHVAVFKATSAKPYPDPIIYLDGGPGGMSFKALDRRLDGFAPYMVDRDFIIFDQRGIGLSQPSLDCPEMLQSEINSLNQPSTNITAGLGELTAIRKCHDRLAKANVNFAAFNSEENAADVADLRTALGYKSWNLYGISYGTRLALITMRDFPTGVRSVILDSTFPPDRAINGTEFGANQIRAFRTLWAGCAKDQQCNQNFPQLAKTYSKLIADLNRQPVSVPIKDVVTGKQYKVLLDGNRVEQGIFLALYSRSLIPVLPAAISDAANGRYTLIASIAFRNFSVDSEISYGMYFTVDCGDRVISGIICNIWGVSPIVSAHPGPVSSTIPTFITAGEYDPVTSPEFGSTAGKSLSRSFFFLFPGFGHGVTVSGTCPAGMMLQFLAAPTTKPDSHCIAALKPPQWTSSDF
jgi:pimeloyl-ACP methyl ester carboxylesterase